MSEDKKNLRFFETFIKKPISIYIENYCGIAKIIYYTLIVS